MVTQRDTDLEDLLIKKMDRLLDSREEAGGTFSWNMFLVGNIKSLKEWIAKVGA